MPIRTKLTKAVVDDLLKKHQQSISSDPENAAKQEDVFDTELNGLLVRLGKTKAAYGVLLRRNGKLTRVTIGEHGVYYPDHSDAKFNARKQARGLIADMDKGENPNEIKKERREQGLTLQAALDNYLLDNPQLKPRTVKEYRAMLKNHAADWLNKPIKTITPDMIQKLHTKLTRDQKPEQANKVVRTLRAIFYQNKALLPENPARLPRKKWNKTERRTGVVKDFQLSTEVP